MQGSYDAASAQMQSLRDQVAALREGGVTKKERKEIKALNSTIGSLNSSLTVLSSALDAARRRTEELFRAFAEQERKMLNERLDAIRDQKKEYEAARKAQAEYDAADTLGKATIMQKRAEASEKTSVSLNQQAEAAMKEAERMAQQASSMGASRAEEAKALFEQANLMVDQAESMIQRAQDASDRAKDERDQAAQLLKQAKDEAEAQKNQNQPDTPGSTIRPSSSVLADAAKIVDRYSRSLRLAEEAAAAGQTVIQFQQTNTSPESLSASQIYRQTKNLLSAAEFKIAGV